MEILNSSGALLFLILVWQSEKLAVLCSCLSCIVPSNLIASRNVTFGLK